MQDSLEEALEEVYLSDSPTCYKPGSPRLHRRRNNGVLIDPDKYVTVNSTKRSPVRSPNPSIRKAPQPLFPVENGYRRGIRLQMAENSDGDDIQSLEDSIRMFEKNRLEDKGDLTRAKDKVRFLNLRKGLCDAIQRRRSDLLDKAMADICKSKFVDQFDPALIRRAKSMADELSSLDRFIHPVLLLNQRTTTELRRYTKPPEVMKNTMAAAFLLLGESAETVEEWDHIRGVLGRVGNASVRLRLNNFNPSKVSTDTIEMADSFLKSVNIDSARQASNGCAAFFLWAKRAIASAKGEITYTPLQTDEI